MLDNYDEEEKSVLLSLPGFLKSINIIHCFVMGRFTLLLDMMLFSLLIGRLKLKVAPTPPLPSLPSILFSAHISPPWASIILLQINKPSPIPGLLSDFVANFENNLGKISESIPLPVSFILTLATS